MNNAIVVGVVVLILLVFLLAYVVWQETRAQRHWQRLVEAGDREAIRRILETEMERWRRGRPPRGVPVPVWAGVQQAQVTEVGPKAVSVSTSAEGQYEAVNGRRREVTTPLEEGMKLFVKLAEMFLYELPHLRFEEVRIDVYSTFRQRDGSARQRPILSGAVDRATASEIDWDVDSPEAIVRRCGARFRLSERGAVLPLEPADGARTRARPFPSGKGRARPAGPVRRSGG